jgi:VIT1/CCC1 family predicted Fe2+/Mn2+ transporter
MFAPRTTRDSFVVSAWMTAAAFAAVGAVKGRITRGAVLISSAETLAIGALAAMIAYAAGHVLRALYFAT